MLETHGEMLMIAWTNLPGPPSYEETLYLNLDLSKYIVSLLDRVSMRVIYNLTFSPESFALFLCFCAFPDGCTLTTVCMALTHARLIQVAAAQGAIDRVRTILLNSDTDEREEAMRDKRWVYDRISKLRKKILPLGLEILHRKDEQYLLLRSTTIIPRGMSSTFLH